MSEKARKKPKTWYLQSENDKLSAFIMIRSPYKGYVEKKVLSLSDGQGFLKWQRFVLTDTQEMNLAKQNFEFNVLYTKSKEAVNQCLK